MSKDYKLVCFDVDGTLVETKSGATFRKSPDDWQWLPGRLEKIKELQENGTYIAVCTNQGGVAFGYMKQEEILSELTKMRKEARIVEGGLYICYTHPKATIEKYKLEDDRRKPGPGMLFDAMDDFEAEPEDTLFVGDRSEDEQAARAAGCDFIWSYEFFGDEDVTKDA